MHEEHNAAKQPAQKLEHDPLRNRKALWKLWEASGKDDEFIADAPLMMKALALMAGIDPATLKYDLLNKYLRVRLKTPTYLRMVEKSDLTGTMRETRMFYRLAKSTYAETWEATLPVYTSLRNAQVAAGQIPVPATFLEEAIAFLVLMDADNPGKDLYNTFIKDLPPMLRTLAYLENHLHWWHVDLRPHTPSMRDPAGETDEVILADAPKLKQIVSAYLKPLMPKHDTSLSD